MIWVGRIYQWPREENFQLELSSVSPFTFDTFFKKLRNLKNWDEMNIPGIPIVAQWLMNPTSVYEDKGLLPSLPQWVKDPVLPWAVV